jgi:large subunit ribosomal protein L3
MAKGILGQKVGMTQVYDDSGKAVPVTVIHAGPCHVLQLRTQEQDGYEAVQLGFRDKKRSKGNRSRPSQASRAERGHVANISSKRSKRRASSGAQGVPKADCEPKRFIRELRGPIVGYEVGQELTVNALDGVVSVDVTGISKGRGFSGVMKRHGFQGQRATHGVKKCHRHPGSTGMRQTPGRLFKGHLMAGHYGHAKTTLRNLKVFKIDAENHILLLRGAVPGPNGGYLVIRETNKVG